MKAARLVAHGEPLQVAEVELAAAGPGEVVVEVAYGGVNPVDRYGALGRVATDGPLPRTLGGEASGWVDGCAVMVRGHGLGATRDGLWAAKAVVPSGAVIDLPDGVDLDAAAAMGIAGVTAWRVVHEKARLVSADRVLVLGASGGVGSMIVSLARSIGATVWGQTAHAGKAQWIRDRGADEVVVGDAATVAAECRGLRPTVVFDPLGGSFFGAAVEVLAPRGRLVPLGTSAGATGDVPLQVLYRKSLSVLAYGGLMEDDGVLAVHIRDAFRGLRDGRFEVVVDRVLPLESVNDAFAALVDRTVMGKLLLDPRA